ncbi:GGDEF domain-containing protein [Methyloterricola oryzae]|uniref:GGDEF domain-containing protein n=1 Tax=Methyloterricola oryzae TaxID=1495050 RepID=UPI0005EB3BC8|nr:sensor domain-containing diguanylate cyclase [Methyloterricola oryzae]
MQDFETRRTATSLSAADFSAERVLEAIAEPILVLELDGTIRYLNQAAKCQFARRQLPEPEKLAADLLVRVRHNLTNVGALPDVPIQGVTCHANAEGENLALTFAAYPMPARGVEPTRLAIRLHRRDESSALLRKLLHYATHDELTGLVNRREILIRLRRLLRAGRCRAQHMLFFMDLDHFKRINDTCGHRAGDETLRRVAALLSAQVRNRDTLGRLGGDEFVLIMEHCPEHKALETAHAMVDAVRRERICCGPGLFKCGLSVGVLALDGSEGDAQTLLDQAEAACYEAKRSAGAWPAVLRRPGSRR